MNYKQLGKSALRLSTVGFGCMSLKGNLPDNERLIHRAIDYGINFFDTADLYDKGFNELLVGQALKTRRSEVVIATKVGNQWREDGSSWDWNPRKAYIIEAVEASLKRLETDYIDLYQLHGGTIDDPVAETIEAFERLQQQGKIRYYGISSIRPNVIDTYIRRSSICSVMMQYSLLDRRPEESCFPTIQEHGIGVLTRGAVAGGLLVNKAPKTYLNYSPEQVLAAAGAVVSNSGDERTPAQTAIQWVLDHPAVTSAVVGIRTIEQLKEVAEAVARPWLTQNEKAALGNEIELNFYLDHRLPSE